MFTYLVFNLSLLPISSYSLQHLREMLYKRRFPNAP